MHFGGRPPTHGQVVSSTFQLGVQLDVLVGSGRVAEGDAQAVVNGAMLPEVRVSGTQESMVVRGQLREEGEYDPSRSCRKTTASTLIL